MAISLETLPEDALLSILELGGTCRTLYELSEQASFWIVVTRNASRLDPLPLPLFRRLETLSAVEARELCVRYLKTKRNLDSKTPQYWKHRVFSLPEGSRWLSHFGFLPGGKLGITIQDNGTISIYDLSVCAGGDGSTASSLSPEERIPVGRLVAQHRVGWPVDLFDFRFRDDDGNYLIVAVSSYRLSAADHQTKIAVIRFDFSDDDALQVSSPPKRLIRIQLTIDRAKPIVLRGDLLIVHGMTDGENDGEQSTTLVAIDYKKGLIALMEHPSLDTGPETPSQLDLTVEGTDILLYRFTRKMDLEVFVYFDVSRDMQPLNGATMLTASIRVSDIHATVNLSPSVPLPEGQVWMPLHICGTPSSLSGNRVPLIGRSLPTTSQTPSTQSVTSLAWINSRGLIDYLRRFGPPDGDPERSRELGTYVNGHSYFDHLRHFSSERAFAWTKYEVGTCGRRAFWIKECIVDRGVVFARVDGVMRPIGEPVSATAIQVVSLPFVGQPFDEEETSKAVRNLQVPTHVGGISMLKFCDEWGMLAYMRSSAREEQEIHIFDY
ncbi:hypothetical protein FRB90_005823 [Tulasnella sp. 427]|nr:hypothetical protein FRB90_005823 [Tulasnella sp. 427]